MEEKMLKLLCLIGFGLGMWVAGTDAALTKFSQFITPPPGVPTNNNVYYLKDYCSICQSTMMMGFRPDLAKPEQSAATNEIETSPNPSSEQSDQTVSKVLPKRSVQNVLEEEEVKIERITTEMVLDETTTSIVAEATSENVETKNQSDTSDVSPPITLLPSTISPKFELLNQSYLSSNETKNNNIMVTKIKEKHVWQETDSTDQNKKRKIEQKDESKVTNELIDGFVKVKLQNSTNIKVYGYEEEAPATTNNHTQQAEKNNTGSPNKKNKPVQEIEEKILIEQELKQISLDPIEQPSIVIRSEEKSNYSLSSIEWERTEKSMDFEKESNNTKKTYKKCHLLLRFSNSSSNATIISSENFVMEENENSSQPIATTISPDTEQNEQQNFGFIVNFQKIFEKYVPGNFTSVNNHSETSSLWDNIRILTSNPNQTHIYYQGKRLNKTNKPSKKRPKREAVVEQNLEDKLDMTKMIGLVEKLMQVDASLVKDQWILIERKIDLNNGDQNGEDEIVINLFVGKQPKTAQCPQGMFDCRSSEELVCIPQTLRCNGEDNCGNGHDESFQCNDSQLIGLLDFSSTGNYFDQRQCWLAIRILLGFLLICFGFYMISVVYRFTEGCFCRRNNDPLVPMFIVPRGNYISIAGDNIEQKKLDKQTDRTSLERLREHFYREATRLDDYLSDRSKSKTSKCLSTKMDNGKSTINEYISVNNNYGQPQGSTCVSTDVINRLASRMSRNTEDDDQTQQLINDYPPLYSEIQSKHSR